MSKRLNLPSALGILLIALFSANVSQAQTNAYWDVNGTTNGQGGSGNFNSSSAYWTTNSTNATGNTGGPAGGALFSLTSGAAAGQSGNYILNFGGIAGDVKQGGSYEAVGINFLTTGYNWYLDGSGTNARVITTTNGVNIGTNTLTLSNGTTGTNSFTFAAPAPPAPAVYTNSSVFSNNITTTNFVITGTNGGSLILKNYASPAISPFVVYVNSPSTTKFTNIVGSVTNIYTNTVIASISSNAPITVDIGAGSKIMLGSSSSSASQIDANIMNSSASGVALNLTNSGSGVITFNGVISGTNGLVLDNTSNGKIYLNATNTYGGGTIVNSTATGDVRYNTSSAFGTGRITISDGVTSYLRANANSLDVTNAVTIGTNSTLQLATLNSTYKTTWSGVISGAGGINYGYSDAGLYLTGTNSSFGGGVNVSSSGSLYVNKLGMAGANSSIGTNGTITISSSSGTSVANEVRWQGSADEISDKNFALTTASTAATAGVKIIATGATNATLTLNGNINSTGINNKVITLAGYYTNNLVMNGTINETLGYTNSLVVGASSSGKVVLGNSNNSFSGGVTITNAYGGQNTWLEVAGIGNTGNSSYLGKGSTITFGAGTNTPGSPVGTILRYLGTGETSDKVLSAGGSGANSTVMTLDQAGTGNLKFSSALTGSGTNTKTIALQGSTLGTGELAGAISDLGGNVTSLTKSGSGTWKLSGTNTYTGTSTFGGGTTIISGDNSAAVGNVKISGSSTIVRLDNTNAISRTSGLQGANGDVYTAPTLDFRAAGTNFTFNSFGTLGDGSSTYAGGSLAFTNSSSSPKTVTFTNANNYITALAAANRALVNNSSNMTVDFDGNVTIGGTNSGTSITSFEGAGNFNVDGNLVMSTGATAVRNLEKKGAGTLTLQGASNNYTGSTLVSGGTLEVGAAGALPVASSITVSSGAKLKFNQSSNGISVGSLTNAGTLEQNLITITSSGAVNLTGSTLKVIGTGPTLASYTLVSGTSLTGTPTLSPTISGYKLSNSNNSLYLVAKTTPVVEVTPGTYTYSGAIQGPGTAQVNTGGSTATPSLSYSGTTLSGANYGPSSTPPTAPGFYTATATTAEDPNYLAGTSSATAFIISKATPSITAAPTASGITYGQTLADSNLTGGTASTPGSFAFTSPSTSPSVGTATQGVTFTPSDTTNYNTATTSVSVTVNTASQAAVLASLGSATLTFGDTTTVTASGGSGSGNYEFRQNGGTGVVSFTGTGDMRTVNIITVGTAVIEVRRVADSNYNASTWVSAGTLTVSKSTPTITASPTACSISYGQTLADSTLTGGAGSVAGAFAFTTPSTSPSVGTATQGVTFTPSDTTNYNTATTSVSVTVTASAPTGLSYNSPSINGTVGAAISSLTPTVAGSGITYSIDPALPSGLLLNPTTGVISGTPSVASASAVYTVTATNAGGITTATLTVAVAKIDQTITFNSLPAVAYGAATLNLTATASSGLDVSYVSSDATVATVSGSTVTILKAGSTTITASQAGNGNYNEATAVTQTLTVGKATPTISAAPTASDITYGQTLADSNLTGGTASTPGSFAFTSPSTSPNVGTANQGVTFTPNDTANYSTATTSASVTVTASAPTGLSYNSPSINGTVGAAISSLTPAVTGSGITYSIDPGLPSGLLLNPTTGVISGTPSVPSASAIYTVTATNMGGSTTTALTIGVGYAVGPVAVDDALTKSGNNQPLLIPISDLLANDYRITNSSGARATDGDGLSVTAVTSGSGNTATLAGVFIQFTPSSASTDTFTYTVTDGTKTATATVTITTETQAPSFDLQIVKVGTATYSGGNTTVTHDFIGVPGQTYMVEYTTNLSGAWTSAGNQSTGVTGSFSMTITKSGDFVSEWNAHMFFRGRLVR